MKNLIYALFLSFVAVSCSKDDEAVTIVGTWDRSQIGNIDDNGTVSSLTNYEHGCTTEKDNFSFTNNGVFSWETLYSDSDVAPVNKTQSSTCSSDSYPGTYTLDGTSLKTTFSLGVGITSGADYEIVSLTANELKL